MKRVVWHVSSHGWGHAARQRELLRVFTAVYPQAEVVLATDVPRWFWEGSHAVSMERGSPSPTVVESGWDIDLAATRTAMLSFSQDLERLFHAEVSFQKSIGPDLVISDMDPLPLAAASAAGIPARAVGNFTWDWVMAELFPDMAERSEKVAQLHSGSTYLRLPMGPPEVGGFSRVLDVPLLASGPPPDVTGSVSLLPAGPVCLVALRALPPGGLGPVPEGFKAISSGPSPLGEGIINFPPERLSREGLHFSDLVAAADVVISKAGYGIVSQILSSGSPCVLLCGRGFPEERYLTAHLEGRSATVLLYPEDYRDLAWAVSLASGGPLPDREEACGADFIIQEGLLDP
mgnify:CR=1 FL=1